MERANKIALIGTQGYQRHSEDVRLECFPWDKLSRLNNIRDYDIVLLNLLSLQQNKPPDWNSFCTLLNPASMEEILRPGGSIVVVGDPRFSIRRKPSAEDLSKEMEAIAEQRIPPARRKLHPGAGEIEEPFLSWSGIIFHWDNQPSDVSTIEDDWGHQDYKAYLQTLKRAEYSLRDCELDRRVFGDLSATLEHNKGLRLVVAIDAFCQNRYGGALAFSITLLLKDVNSFGRLGGDQRYGPIIFLPKASLSEDDTLMVVLRDLCGVQSELPEPEWVAKFEAPGQEAIDERIFNLHTQIKKLQKDLSLAETERKQVRTCLKLLYDRGGSLEKAVREVLRGMGATVKDPTDPTKEDGWLTVQVRDKTFEGVLEIKSTKNDQFDNDGVRQLLDWIHRGVEIDKKKYKGIFIGASSVHKSLDKRPWAFSDDWKKSAELHQMAALKSEDLYTLYCLHTAGHLDTDEFWHSLFTTNGIFDCKPFVPQKS